MEWLQERQDEWSRGSGEREEDRRERERDRGEEKEKETHIGVGKVSRANYISKRDSVHLFIG